MTQNANMFFILLLILLLATKLRVRIYPNSTTNNDMSHKLGVDNKAGSQLHCDLLVFWTMTLLKLNLVQTSGLLIYGIESRLFEKYGHSRLKRITK